MTQQFRLKFENTISFQKSLETPDEIYRYFVLAEHRNNFLNGCVRFSGSNKNRLFSDPEKDIFNDDRRCRGQ